MSTTQQNIELLAGGMKGLQFTLFVLIRDLHSQGSLDRTQFAELLRSTKQFCEGSNEIETRAAQAVVEAMAVFSAENKNPPKSFLKIVKDEED